jgi:DNA polymerase-4
VGVKVGMTKNEAKKKCPNLVFVTNRMEAYALVSARVKKIVEQYFTEYETLGMDECFLDYRSIKLELREKIDEEDDEERYQLVASIGRKIAQEIKVSLKITISVGIASNKIVAKLATESSKPEGFCLLKSAEEQQFLYQQKLSSVMGIGPRTQAKLQPLRYEKVGDLRGLSQKNLENLVGKFQGRFTYALVNNLPFGGVEKNPYTKSMGATRSMRYYEKDPESVFEELLSEILNRLHKQGRSCRKIIVSIVGESQGFSKKTELSSPSKDMKLLAFHARALMKDLPVPAAVNFIGIVFSKLGDFDQLQIEDEEPKDLTETPPIEQKLITSNMSIHSAAHYGLLVEHEAYGEGVVLAYSGEGLRVRFKKEEKIFDLNNLQRMKILIEPDDWEMVREY